MTGGPAPAPVVIARTAVETIVAHAREAAPLECCGLLLGDGCRILRAVRARNLRDSPTRYEIDPLDHFAAIKAARAEGTAVVGAYHSHPASGCHPSATDQEEAAGRDFLYLIVSLAADPPEIGSYRLWREGSERLDLIVEQED